MTTQVDAPPIADPSMEDVLASIRRILDEGGGEPQPALPDHDATLAATAEPPAEDIFLLDPAMLIEEPTMPQHATADLHEEPTSALLAPEAQEAAAGSLGDLVHALTERRTQLYRSGPTLEDLVREEMRPLVKSWLDANLPPMVERLVRDEIERVVTRAIG
jgi:cell pole-organizing protein PopZ